MTTGQRMKARRKEIGLSAEKVAELLEISPATVYRYENGDIEKVPGDKLVPIANVLQTTPAYLMGWDVEIRPTTLGDMLVYLRKHKGLSQQELADRLGMTRSAIGMYETGEREPDLETLEVFADFYNVDMNTITGRRSVNLPSNIYPLPAMKKIPLVGQISCGTPILAEQNITDYIDLPGHIRADYALMCKGESMINAGILDGDIVYIRQQSEVENGQIAAVLVDDDEATLKRFYHSGSTVQLVAENPRIMPMVFSGEEINRVRVIGIAVAYIHVIE